LTLLLHIIVIYGLGLNFNNILCYQIIQITTLGLISMYPKYLMLKELQSLETHSHNPILKYQIIQLFLSTTNKLCTLFNCLLFISLTFFLSFFIALQLKDKTLLLQYLVLYLVSLAFIARVGWGWKRFRRVFILKHKGNSNILSRRGTYIWVYWV